MPTLRELQHAFRAALLDDDEAAAATVVRGDGLAPSARLAVYRHHVLTTLTAALESAYPVVCRLVDRAFFGWVADRYIRRHPPAGPVLSEFGESFAAFLASFPACRELPYLPDVARLEWALHAAQYAEDAVPLDLGQLAEIPPEAVPRLVFTLDPSLTLLASSWPIDRIWDANQPGAAPDTIVDLGAGGACLQVRRDGDDVSMRGLDPATHAFRAALAAEATLGDAAVAATEAAGEFDLATALQALFAEGLVTGFRTIETPSPLTMEGEER
jgi:hypothetical protein